MLPSGYMALKQCGNIVEIRLFGCFKVNFHVVRTSCGHWVITLSGSKRDHVDTQTNVTVVIN